MEEALFWNLDDDMMTDGMPAGGPASEPDPNPTQNPVEYDSGVYASLWDTDDDSVGDLLLLGSLPSVVDHLPTGYTGTLITDYNNANNNNVVSSYPSWHDNSTNITEVQIVDVIQPVACRTYFLNFTKLTQLDVSNIDTSNTVNMDSMFSGCSSLTTLDISNFRLNNVQNASGLFSNCSSLETIMLPSDKTNKISSFSSWFHMCKKLQTVDTRGLVTSYANNLSMMFCTCLMLNSIDTRDWDTSNVQSFAYLFCGYGPTGGGGYMNLTNIIGVENLNTSSVTQMQYAFGYCNKLTTLDLHRWDVSKVRQVTWMFVSCKALQTLNTVGWNLSSLQIMSMMFVQCEALSSIDTQTWTTSNSLREINQVFQGCKALTTIDISSFNCSNVTNMAALFGDCTALTNIIFDPNIDTGALTGMGSMFSGCFNLSSIDLSKFNTENVTNMYRTFYMCTSLRSLDLTNFKTSSLQNAYQMFANCTNLETIYVSPDFITTSITDSTDMFASSRKLQGQAGTVYDSTKKDKVYAKIDTWDTKGYFSTKAGIVPLSAPEVKRITSNMPDTNNTITSKIKPPVTYNIAPPLPSGTSNGLTFTTSGSGITHIEGTSTGTINYQEFISRVSPGGDCVIDVSYRGQLQGQASVILKGDENRTLATIDLNSDNKREVFFLSYERAIYYYCISCGSGVTFDGDFTIQVYFDSDIEYDVDVETDYFPTVENPLFNLLGLQIYNDTTQTWDTVWEKHSNETIIDENLLLIIRNLQNNLSTGDGMVLRYVSGFTNATKYYYNLEANKTYRARLVRRVQNATDMYDGISDEFGMWIPAYADLSDFIFTIGAIYDNGYGYIVALAISTNNLSPADLTPIDLNNIKYYTSINQSKRTAQGVYGNKIFRFKTFYNGEGAKQEKNNSNSYTHYVEFPYIDNYYTEDVIDKVILSQVVNSTAQDPITSLTTPTITLNNGVLSVKHLSLHSNVANMTLSGETLNVVMEISKTNDFALLTYSQTKQLKVSDRDTYYLDFDDITLARGDSGMNYIRFRTVYSNNQDLYSYTQEISPTYSIEFIIIDPVIDSFTVQLNAQNQIVATVVETTGVPLSVITLEVYKTPTGPLFAEIPLNTGQATILPYTEPGTSYYFKARATNVGAIVYALDDEPDPATGEYLPKILYCKIPLEYTPDYENVAQPHITAQKIQLNRTAVLRFDWTNIVTNAYQTKYNITVISDNTISPSTFEDIQSGMTYQFEDRVDGEHVKFALECQLISSDGTVLKQFMIESPQVELDAVDLVNPSISYSTDRTYHSIKYILNNITKNSYKLAYELLQLKDNDVIVQEKETGDIVPTPSSPDLEGTTELLFDNLDANKSYTLTYKYIFVNPLDSSKTYTITDTISVSTLELLLYAVRNEQVVIDHQIVNQPSTKSNYAISWTEPLEGSEPVTNYIIRYKKNNESLYHSIETSTIHATLLATDLGLNNEDILHLDIGVKYTLYDNSEQIIWKSLNDITVAITDYVLYRTSYPDTEVMMRKLFRAAESDSAEQLVREIQSL